MGVLIRTPVGNILHTGDFKFDQTPIDGRLTDLAALAKFGKQGIMLLMSDSTNATHSGVTNSEAVVGRALRPIIAQAEGTVIVASFSSHIHRLQQVCDAATAAGRKVVVTGRSMLRNTEIARNLGYLKVDADNIVDAYDMKNLRADQVVILCTGSQGEPLSALARMAAGEHRSIHIGENDTVILSATPVPGNEKAVSTVVNRLLKIGAKVYDKSSAEVHVSGHAAAEELKLMLNLTRPEYFVPVHGETRHLMAHKELAQQVGIPEDYIFVLENGDVLEFDAEGARVAEPVQNGVIYVDGLNVGDADNVVLRDRQHMSQDGIITLVLSINRRSGKVVGQAEIVARGATFPEGRNIEKELLERATKTLERSAREHSSLSSMRKSVRDSASQLVWEATKQRPMVIPVVLEV
jgi:ribonuclease J